MPREYEMRYLYDVTVDAISQYSEDLMSAYWFINIEHTVLRGIVENDSYIINFFRPYQLTAMRELIHRKLWVKWSDKDGRPVLSPDPLYAIQGWDDTVPIPNGAD